MTDIRDREPQLRLESDVAEPAPRTSLVARVLSPIRRVTAGEAVALKQGWLAKRGLDVAVAPALSTSRVMVWTAIVVVLLPMLTAGVYLFFIASDQYVSEARFAVRQAQAAASKDLSAGGKSGAGPSTSAVITGTVDLGGEDADIVANYIHSRAIVEDVSRTLDVRAIFARPEADVWARLSKGASIEDEVRYWNRMVSVYIESTSGIVTVSAAAFRRDDALALMNAIVASSERLVNSMSLKMRLDTIKTAENEVRRAEGDYRFAMADLTSFRNAEHIVDPIAQSKSTSTLLMQMIADKIETESKLFVAIRLQGPTAPGVASLRAKLEITNTQVADLKQQLAGDRDASKNMASALSRFETLELNSKFAERMYGFARDGVERARIAAIRQQIYLAVFVPPSLPEDYSYPLRWTDFLMISCIGLMTWLSGVIVSASVLDHRL